MGNVLLSLVINHASLAAPGNQFLPDIRRITHYGVQFRKLNYLALPLTRCSTHGLVQNAEFARVLTYKEKILPSHARIIFSTANITRGQVQSGEVCREGIDVTTVELFQSFFVSQHGIEMAFAIVGPHEKATAATRRIEGHTIAFANTEGVDDINDIFIGLVLAKLVPLFRADQLLEDPAQNVSRNLFELEFLNCFYELAPCFNGVGAGEGGQRCPFTLAFIRKEDRFVVSSGLNGLLKTALKHFQGRIGIVRALRNSQFRQVIPAADCLVEQNTVAQHIHHAVGGTIYCSAP